MSETIYASLFTFFLGLLLGNRLALWRERRKEFNEVAVRIRVALKERADDPQPYFSTAEKIEKADMELFIHLLPIWKRSRFKRVWQVYEAERKFITRDEAGQAYYESPQKVANALQNAISFTVLR